MMSLSDFNFVICSASVLLAVVFVYSEERTNIGFYLFKTHNILFLCMNKF